MGYTKYRQKNNKATGATQKDQTSKAHNTAGALASRISKRPQDSKSSAGNVGNLQKKNTGGRTTSGQATKENKKQNPLENNPLFKLTNRNSTGTRTSREVSASEDIAVELRRLSGSVKIKTTSQGSPSPQKASKNNTNNNQNKNKNKNKNNDKNGQQSAKSSQLFRDASERIGGSGSSGKAHNVPVAPSFSFRHAASPPILRLNNLVKGTSTKDVRAVLESMIGPVLECRSQRHGDVVNAEALFADVEDTYRAQNTFDQSSADGKEITAVILKANSIPMHLSDAASNVSNAYAVPGYSLSAPPYTHNWAGPALRSDLISKSRRM